MRPISHVVVVIPVNDEEERLDACLASVRAAAAQVADRCPTDIVVVLDTCIDASEAVAARHPVLVVRIAERNVGAARGAGVAAGATADPATTWVANTDADTVVPAEWLAHHLAAADAGADVVLGAVRPDFVGLSPAHVAHWHDTHPVGVPTGNTHGANLGIRASVYDDIGGFAALPEHEDVELVDRARARGAAVVATADAAVVTSARFHGRTPGGYAGYLRRLARRFAGGASSTADPGSPGVRAYAPESVASPHG